MAEKEKPSVRSRGKAASLDGLIQSKGADRPSGSPQRGAETAPAPAPAAPIEVPVATPEPRTKALSVKLTETDYQRLRRYAFDRNATHQDVLEEALLALLDQRRA